MMEQRNFFSNLIKGIIIGLGDNNMADKPKMQDDVKQSWKEEVTGAIYNNYEDAKQAVKKAGAAVADTAKKVWGEGPITGKGPYKPGTNKLKNPSGY